MIYSLFFFELFRGRPRPFADIGLTVLGLFYIALPFSLFCMIGLSRHLGAYSPQLALGFLVLLWTNDTGAYLVGSRFGRHKLSPRISPGKTWEGTLAGLVATAGIAWAWSHFYERLSAGEWILFGIVIAITATLGDLVASMLKRSLALKDSGRTFPGHGGFLDRFDGLLGAAPFAYLFLYLLDKM
jgi:phosphatidate cytidylyltransferase